MRAAIVAHQAGSPMGRPPRPAARMASIIAASGPAATLARRSRRRESSSPANRLLPRLRVWKVREASGRGEGLCGCPTPSKLLTARGAVKKLN